MRLLLSDEMLDRVDRAIEERRPASQVIAAAFEGVPLANFAIGTLLQETGPYELVVCVRRLDAEVVNLLARETEVFAIDGPGRFVSLNHGARVDRALGGRHVKHVQLTRIEVPPAVPVSSEEDL